MSRESLAEFLCSQELRLALIAVLGPIVLVRIVAWVLVTFVG